MKKTTIIVTTVFAIVIISSIFLTIKQQDRKKMDDCSYKKDSRFDVVEPLKDMPFSILDDLEKQAEAIKKAKDANIDWIYNDKTRIEVLRDLVKIPGQEKYLGVYVENYEVIENTNFDNYIACGEDIAGQIQIKGDYVLFMFDGEKIYRALKIPDYDDEFAGKVSFSLLNTKANNFYFYGGSESDGEEIERSNLINFKDYTGDGLEHEFLLTGQRLACSHLTRGVAGYDVKFDEPIFYNINKSLYHVDYEYWATQNSPDDFYWVNRFKPDSNGDVEIIWQCGDHGAVTQETDRYIYNDQSKEYQRIYHGEEACF
jgi:hypothetical protein